MDRLFKRVIANNNHTEATMRLKSLALLTLLPIMTACAANCDRVIKYDGFQIGKERIDSPRFIREEKMPVTWKLLMDNRKAFAEMSKISYALDEGQYKTCMKIKTAPEAERKALQDEIKRYNAGIDGLMEVLLTPPGTEFATKLDAWNKDYRYVVKAGSKEDSLKKQDAEDEILMEKPAGESPEKAPAAEPSKGEEPAVKAPEEQKPAETVSPAPANGTAPAAETAPSNGSAPATGTPPANGTTPAPATETAPATGTTPAPATEPAPATTPTAPAPGY